MDIHGIVTQAMKPAFKILEQEVASFTFHQQVLGGQYDPTTNSYPTTPHPNIPVLQSQFDYRELNNTQISIRDMKFIVKKDDIGFLPAEGDHAINGDETWDVQRAWDYPGVIVLQMRRR